MVLRAVVAYSMNRSGVPERAANLSREASGVDGC